MATTKEIKRRIKSVKNTKKITKAMELVAASKMRKAVQSTIASRSYAREAWDILHSLGIYEQSAQHLLITGPIKKTKRILAVIMTSNRGLCGAYNSKVIKQFFELIHTTDRDHIDCIVIGKKGEHVVAKLGIPIIASFSDLPDHIRLADSHPVARYIMKEYNTGQYDKVMIMYTDYKSPLEQVPHTQQLLPIPHDDLQNRDHRTEVKSTIREYLFEPEKNVLLVRIIEQLSMMQIYQMLLESSASEQSARMLAMKNATEAAGEMIDDLTLVFNKARQAGITQEMSEISAGVTSISS